MDIKETTSVSKGSFIFKNGTSHTSRNKRKRKHCVVDINESELWYRPYKIVKQFIDGDVETIQSSTFTKVKAGLRQFVANSNDKWCLNNLPTAVLVTGVNQGDHYQFFDTFTNEIRDNASVAVIQGRNCLNLKSAINTMVSGLIDQQISENNDETLPNGNMRRSQYNIQVLKSWYEEKFGNDGPTLIIVIPDFELFRKDVLIEFIQLLLTINDDMPMVLVLGVATDISILQRSLPSHLINKLQLCKFQSTPSKQSLEQILNNVILSPNVCVNLSANVLNFLTDIFLYFDFSINSFLKGYQYCLMEHYYKGNAFALCGTYKRSLAMTKHLKHADIEEIRQLQSFRSYVESRKNPSEIISLLEDDEYFLDNLPSLLKKVHRYFNKFHCFVRLLFTMLKDLPKNFIGKQLRDVYSFCCSTNIFQSERFTDLWQLLTMLSKEEFVQTLDAAVGTLTHYKETFCLDEDIGQETSDIVDKVVRKLTDCSVQISNSATTTDTVKTITPIKLGKDYKEELKNKMMEQTTKTKCSSDLRKQMDIAIGYIKDQLAKYLIPFNKGPALHELFVFDDVKSVRQHIMGAPRAVIHSALQNPHLHLQCRCCALDDPAQIKPTLPDISIAFKLHLESGQMINLFDWLQAFNIIHQVDPDEESTEIQPEIQARFVRTVAELQFLGYIKSSKRKTDHVTRLTW